MLMIAAEQGKAPNLLGQPGGLWGIVRSGKTAQDTQPSDMDPRQRHSVTDFYMQHCKKLIWHKRLSVKGDGLENITLNFFKFARSNV